MKSRRRVRSLEALFLAAEALFNADALTYAQFRSVRRKLTAAATSEGCSVLQNGTPVMVFSVAKEWTEARKRRRR
jgi:hypothetical protein